MSLRPAEGEDCIPSPDRSEYMWLEVDSRPVKYAALITVKTCSCHSFLFLFYRRRTLATLPACFLTSTWSLWQAVRGMEGTQRCASRYKPLDVYWTAVIVDGLCLLMLMFCPDQELCSETPRVPRQELGAGERQTDPTEDREGERRRRRGEGLAASVLWWIQWGRQPHQVRSMKQVCVLVFVSVGVCVCIRVCDWTLYVFIFTVHLYKFLLVSCVMSLTLRVCVCALLTAHCPHIWLVSPYHTQQHKLSGFPTTEFQPAEMFPHFCPPLLVSKNPADIVFAH